MDIEWVAFSVAIVASTMGIWRWCAKAHLKASRRKFGFESGQSGRTADEITQSLDAEMSWVRSERVRLEAWLRDLANPPYEEMTPLQVLGRAEPAEIQALRQITEANTSEPKALLDELRSIGSNGLAQFVRVFTRSDPDEVNVPYQVLLQDACKHLGVKGSRASTDYGLELALQKKAFERLVNSMPAAERERFLVEFSASTREPSLGKEAIVGGSLVAANLSGFGLYLASSTALGAITSAIGVTLPFAVYTGMSSTLAVLIGPVGWVALGAWLVHKLGRPDPKKVIAGTLLIANVRQRLIAIRDEPIPFIRDDIGTNLAQHENQLTALRAKLARAERYRLSEMDRLKAADYELPDRPKLASDRWVLPKALPGQTNGAAGTSSVG